MKEKSFVSKSAIVFLTLLLGIYLFISPLAFLWKTQASGAISGRVFNDFNGNGVYNTSGGTTANPTAIDKGVQNVTVTAYDSNGVSRGTATTASDGTYTLNATGTGPYRVEFTSLPTGYLPSARSTDSVSGGSATDAGSTVQFVNDGTTANVNLALNRAGDYCQDNPEICSQLYGLLESNQTEAVFTVPYHAGSTRTTGGAPVTDFSSPGNTSLATTDQVGTTFGMAYNRNSRIIYAAASMKKHAKFGPNGTGAIYQINRGTGAVSLFADINTIFGANTAGANPHNAADYNTDNGNATWDAVGKVAFGGMAISEDMAFLYVMNLANRTLYKIPTSGALNTTTISTAAFPTTGVPNCANASDVRPFAVTYYESQLYVGAVCSADVSDSPADLRGYIYQVNPTTLAFNATPVLNFPLNYPRLEVDPNAPADWLAWRTNFSNLPTQTNFIYPQPMFTDIDFDNGNLIISLRDRNGDQTGYNNASNPADSSQLRKGITGGDILRACGNPTSGWTLESNGRCGGIGGAPQNTGEGPGEGEYYYQENYHPNGNPHDEVGNGAAMQLPGHNVMVSSIMDPPYLPNDNIYDSGGFRWFDNATGAQNRAYLAYLTGDFGKANGIGNTVPLCDAAPIEVGNRLWKDLNGNGAQDPNEPGISGATVRLYNAANTAIATAVTDANGEYYFVGSTAADTNTADNIGQVNGRISPNTSYQIRFDLAANYATGGVLNGFILTTANATAQAGDDDSNDSDASNVTNPTGSPAGTYPVISFTTGTAGTNNHTLDVGFQSFSLGNRVWFDTDNDGTIDLTEVGISNVSVSVFLDADNNNVPDTIASPIATLTTDSTGYYRFDGLRAGNYVVRVNPSNFASGGTLYGYQSSATTGTDPDTNVDSNDDGLNPANLNNPFYATNGVLSNNVILGPSNTEPTGETDLGTLGQGNLDNLTNLTVDFGFYRLGLSGVVWNDMGAGALYNNAIFDTATETGRSGVTVRLYTSAGTEIPVGADGILGTADDANGGITTNTSGGYSFNGLAPDDYIVRITPPSGVMSSLINVVAPDPDNNTVNDDNGTPGSGVTAGLIVSLPITLAPNTEPTIVNATATTLNPTVDFGLIYNYSLGNRVWFDTNNDGRINSGEVGLANVSVSLFADGNADGAPDTPATPLNTVTTDASGYYRFDTLAGGTYVVRINPSNFANGAVLAGYLNTTGNVTGDVDSTAASSGENGINPSSVANSVQTNGILSNVITLGPGTTEPTAEADVQASGQGSLDNQSDMTVDFGFYRTCLSGTVWADNGGGGNSNNGILNAGELPSPGIRVQLYDSAGNELLVGADGILGTSDDAVNGMQTNMSGNYSFCGLIPGQYRVVVIPSGGTSSTPSSTNPDDNVDNNDDGTPGSSSFAGRVVSGLVTITPGNTGALGNTAVTNATGLTSNPTVDFGFFLPPTSVELASFEAFADFNGGVKLKWTTGGEADNLGFNIYRELGGKRELLTSSPIAGSALRSLANSAATGDSYSWFDPKGTPDAVYYLEDLDLEGNTNLHGAIVPTLTFSGISENNNSKLLAEINEANTSSRQFELIENSSVDAKPKTNAKVQARIAAQNGVKVSVNHDGWYRVSAEQLQNSGFDLNSNFLNWKLFANGIEVPIKINADYSIEFFGRGTDTPSTDKQVYYLVNSDSAGQRVRGVKGGRIGQPPTVSSFANTAKLQDKTIYASGILNGEAENWFGSLVMASAPTAQNLTVYNPEPNGQARLSVKLQGLTTADHSVSLKFNEINLGTVNYTLYANQQFDFDIPMSSVREGANQIVLRSVGGSTDISVVDSISLNYARQYKAQNNRLRFTVPAGQSVKVSEFQSDNVEIYEIRNGTVSEQLETEVEKANSIRSINLMPANTDRELLLIGSAQAESVLEVAPNEPSDWKNTANRADFVIITPKTLQTSAERLAAHRNGQGLLTKVVLVEDLYDEFTFGAHSPEAVKRFFQAAKGWQTKPQFALLFGDSSYDVRSYLATVNRDLIPTKMVDTFSMETASDAWLADFNNDSVEDIGLGRIPVITQTEADRVVDKLIRYDQQSSTQRSNLFVSDTGFDTGINLVRNTLPNNVSSNLISRVTMTDAEMRSQILQRFNESPTVVTYSGHGTPTLWTNANVLRADDASLLANQNLSFYMFMTCLNGYTHGENGDSLAETMLKSENGAVAVWTSSAVTFLDGQIPVSQYVTGQLFKQNPPRLGSILRLGKLNTPDLYVRQTWLLIGDPTIIVR